MKIINIEGEFKEMYNLKLEKAVSVVIPSIPS